MTWCFILPPQCQGLACASAQGTRTGGVLNNRAVASTTTMPQREPSLRAYLEGRPNTGDKQRSSNMLRLRLLHPLVGRLRPYFMSSGTSQTVRIAIPPQHVERSLQVPP